MLSPWRVLTRIALCLGAVMGVLTAVAVGSAAAPATASAHRGTASIHDAAFQAPVPGQAPAPGPQEVTGPVGTLPDGAFPAGMNVVAELPGLRTATSNTYLTSSGSRVLMAYPGPVNYHDPGGALQHIDNSAVASTGGGWHNGANAYQADVPASLTQPVSITEGSASLAFTFLGAQVGSAGAVLTPSGATATARASTVTFESSLPDTSISYAFGGDGLGESLTLQNAAAPTIYTWRLAPGAGLTARATPAGTIALTTATGATAMTITAPSIEDADHLVGPAPAMSLSADGTTLSVSLSPDAAWVAAPGRAFPVTVDPSVTIEHSYSECQLFSSAPTVPECQTGSTYGVGYNTLSGDAHTLLRFDSLASSVPYDSLVQNAYLDVYEQGARNGTAIPVSVGTIADKSWNPTTATWNDYDSGTGSPWSTPGGDDTATPGTGTVTAGTANGWLAWDPVAQVQAWVNGEDLSSGAPSPPLSPNEGFLLSAPAGAANSIALTNWSSTTTSQWPYLALQYTPRIGTAAPLHVLRTQIDDKTTLGVNAADGDLSVNTSLFKIEGVGLPLALNQTYDAQGATQTSMGTSSEGAAWSLSPSFDQPLLVVKSYATQAVVDLDASGGTNAVFTDPSTEKNPYGTFPAPPGLDATLAANANHTFTLTFDQTGEAWTFSLIPGHYGAYYGLSAMTDRNGDTITYGYDPTGTMLSSVTDTQGRVTTIAYNTNNLVSSVTDSTGRRVAYTYENPVPGVYRLSSAAYGGSTTAYAYDANGNLDEITDPIGNITTVGYNSAEQVTSLTRVTNDQTLAGDTTTYAYTPSSAATPATPGTTTVTDPLGHATTYQWDPADRVTMVTDANGNHESTAYNAQSNVTQLTDAMANPGITTLAYDNNDNLDKLTSPPTSSGQTPAVQTLGYATPGSVAGGVYLPSSATDAQRNCTAYTYDAAGNVANSYAGQSTPCDGATGGAHASSTYEGDPGVASCGGRPGERCSTIDANQHTTTYAYNTLGQLVRVTPPAPRGATTITYDALSRPETVTTPTGTLTYTYDVWDRVTELAYASGPTISYTYDADGNITTRVDPSGTTRFTYDTLNQMTADQLPGGADACPGSNPAAITLTYDTAANLTGYCNGSGTTTYSYDPANRLTGEAAGASSCPGSLCTSFAYNADNERTTTAFGGGAAMTVGYDGASNETSVVATTSTSSVLTSFAYTYAQGLVDTNLRQTMTESDPIATLTTTYGYDGESHLTSAASSSGTLDYRYDPAGNRCSTATTCTSPTYAYNAANELTAGPAGPYGYDASGEQTSSPQLSNLTYNTAGQTTSVTPAGGAATPLAYAEVGQSQLTTDGTTTLAYGPLGLDSATRIVHGSPVTTYVIRDSQGNAVGQQTTGQQPLYYLKDGLGSVIELITGTGTVDDRFTYDPYGVGTSAMGSYYEPLRYAGGYLEPASGLVKFGTRYYDPAVGRWTQVDPVGGSIANPDTLNGYIYAGDDPVNLADPNGAFPGLSELYSAVHYFEQSVSIAYKTAGGTLGYAYQLEQYLQAQLYSFVSNLSSSLQALFEGDGGAP